MVERKTVTVAGKEYQLKTDAERAAPVEPTRERQQEPVQSEKRSVTVAGAPRQVLLALTLALIVFITAGGKIEKVIAKARGIAPPTDDLPFTIQTVVAWGFLFVGLMVLADIQATSELSTAFAWLILLSILIEFGPEAFNNISKMTAAKQGVSNAD